MVTLALSLALVCSCSGNGVAWPLDEVYPESSGQQADTSNHKVLPPYTVQARASASDAWTDYTALTVDCLEGFVPSKDTVKDGYGGWMSAQFEATGFFRTEKRGGRWWMVTPDGHPFISKGVAVFSSGGSTRQKNKLSELYGSSSQWAKSETAMLKEHGFNSLGAWSNVSVVKALSSPMPYTVILSPMSSYIKYLKEQQKETAGFAAAGWEGYPYDFAMVFDSKFDDYVTSVLQSASQYASDPYCIGYFIDNELPWKDYALDRCLGKWGTSHVNHQKAQEWLDARKGHKSATLSEATAEDRKAFIAYCFGVYADKVTTALHKYDPNHMCLGCRFNQWNYELQNDSLFAVAGKYFDVISVNHYRKWEPDQTVLKNWEKWSGCPVMVTEFYTKGVDSGLGNTSGAGWQVKTQTDRGLFYQNFVLGLLRSRVCVGWHWFTYMDNDPEDTSSDSSNLDSNKGVVTWDFQRYNALLDNMYDLNVNVLNLIGYYDN